MPIDTRFKRIMGVDIHPQQLLDAVMFAGGIEQVRNFRKWKVVRKHLNISDSKWPGNIYRSLNSAFQSWHENKQPFQKKKRIVFKFRLFR